MSEQANAVIQFWRQAGPEAWFKGDPEFDRRCEQGFLTLHLEAARGELESWLETAEGALAVLLLLDQIPRNVFRGSGHAFATDGLARHYADRALGLGHDRAIEPQLRAFIYLPFEHSEELADQQRSVELFQALARDGYDAYTAYALAHLEVIERFGRFPHRNRALGRVSTAEEQAWLDAGGGF